MGPEGTSPIDGVISDRPLYAGEMASSESALLTVMDVSRVIARATVPVNELHFLKVGDPATITVLDSSMELEGRVTVVSPALDLNSTTAVVWVLAANPWERFQPGLTVKVSVLAETVRDAAVIPVSALLPAQEGTGDSVLVVGSDSLAHTRKVQVSIRESDRVQVLRGLSFGEQVVTVGGLGVQDGAKVKVENEAGAKEAGERESGDKKALQHESK